MTTARFPRQVPQKYVLHAPTLLPLTPWIVVISAFAATPRFDAPTLALWAGIHAVTLFAAGFLGLGFVIALGRAGKTFFGFWWVVLIGALVGLVKALSTIGLEELLGLSDAPASAIAARALGGVIVGMWLITLVAYGKTALDSVEKARDTLIRQNVAQRLATEATVTRPEVSESLAVISGLRRDLAKRPGQVSPATIRQVVDSTIRPLSRALWTVESRRYPPPKLVSLYRIALRSLRLRAWLIGAVWAATSFTALAVPLGVTEAATYTAIVGLVAFAAFSLVRLGWTRSVVVSLIVVTLTSVGAVMVGFLLTGLIVGSEPEVGDVLLIVTGVVWMIFVTLGASIVSGVIELRDIIKEDLDTAHTQAMIKQRSADDTSTASTKLIATQLHGSVQSALLGIASALDSGVIATGDVDQKLAAVVDELHLLGSASSAGDAEAAPAPGVALERLLSTWVGLLGTTIDDTSAATLQSLLASSPESADIVREALANAHRHGRATEATIHATTDPHGDVTITVTDNGYGPRSGAPGLGSTLLDTWTHFRWSLSAHPEGGSTLIATITPSGATEPAQ